MAQEATSGQILKEAEERMDKAIQYLSDELRGVRTGRAHPGLVESIKVDYYGSPTALNALATISVPEPRMLVIKPFDQNALGDMEKAILKSELGITPGNDGKVIRLTIPMLSEERRKQLVSRVKELAEENRVTIRNIRRETNKKIEGLEKGGGVAEDEAKDLKEKVQDLTRSFEKKVDEIVDKKTKDVLEF